MKTAIRTLTIEYKPAADMHDGEVFLLEQSVTRPAIALAHGDQNEALRQIDFYFDRLPLVAPMTAKDGLRAASRRIT